MQRTQVLGMRISRGFLAKATILGVCAALHFAASPVLAQPASACGEQVQLQTLLAEVRSLRIELLQEKIERAQFRIAEIEHNIRIAETERSQASSQQRTQAQELNEIQERLTQPSLATEERTELEAYRQQMMTSAASRLAEQASSLAKREAALRDQLGQEQRQRNQLLENLRSLGGTPPRN